MERLLTHFRKVKYNPLSLVNDEIRLLQIEPSIYPDAELRCRLVQTPLGSAPNYVALSYRWGDPNIRTSITVSNKSLSITASLANALRELRQRGYLCVWADALCINQNDPEERSQQVIRMTAVYRSASKVVTFLSCKFPAEAIISVNLFNRLLIEKEELRRAKIEYEKRKKQFTDRTARMSTMECIFAPSLAALVPKPTHLVVMSLHERGALESLVYNPYWRRAWIMQEVTTNPNLEIIWGQRTFTFELIVDVARLAVKLGILKWTTQIFYLQELTRIRSAQLSMTPLSVLEVLNLARDTKVSEARDRIYAILGVTSNGNILVPFPSYTSSNSTVNKEITIRMITMTKSVEFLLMKKDPVSTWYLNWFDRSTFSSRRTDSFTGPSTNKESQRGLYNAYNNRPARFSPRQDSIVVEGLFVDELAMCSPTLAEAQQRSFTKSQWNDIKRYRDRVVISSSTRSMSRKIRWLLDRLELGDSSGDVSYVSGGEKSSGLPSVLREKKVNSEPTKSLVQWLHDCHRTSFKIHGYHLTSWFSEEVTTTTESDCCLGRVMSNLEWQMRLGMTSDGRPGWFNRNAMPGDRIAIISGSRYPAILRECGNRGYCVVGEAIVHGLMCGEGMDRQPRGIEIVNA